MTDPTGQRLGGPPWSGPASTSARPTGPTWRSSWRRSARPGSTSCSCGTSTWPTGPLLDRAAVAREAAHAAGALFVLNDRPDLAVACGADGVHVGQDDVPAAVARRIVGPDALVGPVDPRPGGTGRLGRRAGRLRQRRPGRAHPDEARPPGTGLDYIRLAAERSPHPFFVTGGVSPATLPAIAAAGATRFVVVRALTEAPDPAAVAKDSAASSTHLTGRARADRSGPHARVGTRGGTIGRRWRSRLRALAGQPADQGGDGPRVVAEAVTGAGHGAEVGVAEAGFEQGPGVGEGDDLVVLAVDQQQRPGGDPGARPPAATARRSAGPTPPGRAGSPCGG